MNNCYIPENRHKYGETSYIQLISATGDSVADASEMRDEIAKLMSLTSSPAERNLIPIQNINSLKNQTLYFKSVQFLGFDGFGANADTGNGQTTNQFSGIIADPQANSPMKLPPQSNFRQGILANTWIHNHLNPVIQVNDGVNILKNLSSVNQDKLGYSSIGLPLNICWNLDMEISNFRSINGRSKLAYYSPDLTEYQNYILMALMEVWVGKYE